MEFSNDEGPLGVEWALVSKVLSPATVHTTTIFYAMKPAWGIHMD